MQETQSVHEASWL